MKDPIASFEEGLDKDELQDWLGSLEGLLEQYGPQHVGHLLQLLERKMRASGVDIPFTANTPYVNTIHVSEQPRYPGDREIERRIKSIIRWNAMAMVVRANREEAGIGGHISTYASAATLYEVAFNHFLRGKSDDYSGDTVFIQGHATPGIYARAYLEGRLTEKHLENFRRELREGGGLSSYPHPWLMPGFWEYPTVSMGLSPIMAIYHARFLRYLEDRGLKEPKGEHVWCFIGDGESDEPESLGAITLASREKLDNLIFVINCNLQRLDGPVRGNGKIIQELEAAFRGAGWNVLKVIWGGDWDPLLAEDRGGQLVKRMNEVVDGNYQKYTVMPGAYTREHFFGKTPELAKMAESLTDQQIERMRRGGHDPAKVYAAYKAAVEHTGQPTVILAKTVKGYGLGEAGEGRNITHQQKKLNEEEMKEFRTRFNIPLSDEDVAKMPFYKPAEDSPEMLYLKERRQALGGYVPSRVTQYRALKAPGPELFEEFDAGTEAREVSTTMVFVRILSKLLRDKDIGKLIVPIVPDESRTFGMEALFRQVGIYSHVGQLYEPVDSDTLLYYKEATDGQILEEGITEAGSMASFIAAGTSYSSHGVNTIPFFIYYSMFGFQRVGDMIWAAADCRAKGFLVGGTAGRTTLAGEGLQHQDGHSHLMASAVPNLMAYDPAFAYEIAVIVREGIRRMYEAQEDIFYYLTVGNENYAQPPKPGDVDEGILKGMYRFKATERKDLKLRAHLFGSGAIMNQVLKAAEILEEKYNVAVDTYSVTSYKALRQDALDCERWNMLHPDAPEQRLPHIARTLMGEEGVFVAASDYVKILPDAIGRWFPKRVHSLGTDGFGRSESREALRDFFEVDARYIVLKTLRALQMHGHIEAGTVKKAITDLEIDTEKVNPMVS
ncbi:MAG: pyruvate dehydrogenase (acetyl-transferring), homodimeric type [Candidatus Omnitrophica bacterium]|nr:pyruvate dehydrogenase (acetyl-transferring), homodimeric type [Candidatus Omnitrophota bacterium]